MEAPLHSTRFNRSRDMFGRYSENSLHSNYGSYKQLIININIIFNFKIWFSDSDRRNEIVFIIYVHRNQCTYILMKRSEDFYNYELF